MKNFGGIITTSWQQIIFSFFGLTFISKSIYLMFSGDVKTASAIFGIGFLCFVYANLSRFKKFKGLGFEAELWDDKKKEASDLIERLRDIVTVYTREILIDKVKSGRYDSAATWNERWKLYDELVKQHDNLGQKIDFINIKKIMDDYFLFDMVSKNLSILSKHINDAKQTAINNIKSRPDFHSNPLKYENDIFKINSIKENVDNPLAVSCQSNLAGLLLENWETAKTTLKGTYGVDLEDCKNIIDKLYKLSDIYMNRPVEVTSELISWADENR